MSDLNQRIEAAFAARGIAIPFPQRDLHLRSPELTELVTALARRHFTPEELSAARMAPHDAAARDMERDVAAWVSVSGPRVWDDVALDALVGRLRGPGGLAVADRRHLLSVYPRCFVGRDAVDWLVRHEEVTRDEAVRLGELLVTRGVIRHVLDEHSFRDGNFFYRFRADETLTGAA